MVECGFARGRRGWTIKLIFISQSIWQKTNKYKGQKALEDNVNNN